MKTQPTNIRIDKKLKDFAKKNKINLRDLLEDRLKELLEEQNEGKCLYCGSEIK